MCLSVENRPYWFDIENEMTNIWDEVLDIVQSIGDTLVSLENDEDDDDLAIRFTGVNLVSEMIWFRPS